MNRSLVEKRPILGLFCKKDLIITGAYKLWPHYVTCRICRLLRKEGGRWQCSAVCYSVLQRVECADYRGRRGDDGSVLQCSAVCCSAVC